MSQPDTIVLLARALGAKYDVRRLVGQGGFAEVYEVWDKELERRLAVKVLRPDVAWTAGTVERFQRETRAAARLEHPNILPIHFVGEGEGLAYYAMPFVEGMSLGELLKRSGALPADRALAIIIPILDALDHAHRAGLLHRDVKPDNIMLDSARGRPLLVDFGIARRIDASSADAGPGLTQTGLVIGTPHYMSPEQALGDPNLGPGSDLYSLGAVLFQMVTGSPPFDGESSQQIVGKHIAEPPPAAADVNPSVPRQLSDTILRCLAKQPNERFHSAAEVIRALEGGGPPTNERMRASAAQAATELLVSGATDRRKDGTLESRKVRPSNRPTVQRLSWIALAVVLPVLALGAGALYFRPPQIVFENRLAGTVAVQVAGEERRLLPGGSLTVKLERGRPLALSWRLVRPETGDGALGVPVGDTLTVVHPNGRVRVSATASPRNRAYFAPLITNETGRPITITVNAGLAGALACHCTVPAGAVRMEIGYYPLFVNSTVRAEEAGTGRTATFRDLGPQVDAARGVVGLLFRQVDLR
jgi:tRNA A-37 threonylcarbamoyl transferase component Bud32